MQSGNIITNFNNLLIKYLNDLVNKVEANDDDKARALQDFTTTINSELTKYNLSFSNEAINSILKQAFSAYASILRTHFDGNNIHRIDVNHPINDELNFEVNEVINNLINAINNINNTPEYSNLIKKIKDSIIYQLRLNNTSYNNYSSNVEIFLNETITKTFNSYLKPQTQDFFENVLPTFYKYSSDLTHTSEVIQEWTQIIVDNSNVNAERDAFINQMMEIEIHESVENGVLVLTVIDQMGQEQKYYGQDAMDKLTSYNQLFESSRPGKKVDTSFWPPIVEEKSKPVEQPALVETITTDQPANNDVPTPIDSANPQDLNSQELSPTIDKQIPNEDTNQDDSSEDFIKKILAMDDVKNERPVYNFNGHIESNEDNQFNQLETTVTNSDTNGEGFDKLQNILGNNEDTNNNSLMNSQSSFIPNYDNPNAERDNFIKLSTGIMIEEDKDTKGRLFLRVTEPSGREIIYTGKEAVTMINNYNKVYLDANPGKKVDTTLIDNYKDN